MKNFILFDDDTRKQLLPLTFIRPVAEIRIGILTVRKKWEKYLGADCSYKTEEYLRAKFPMKISRDGENVFINASICPDKRLSRG